jgi:ATP-binding cassette, subfamily B, bacterial CvaB/MchF/RaxB
MSDFVWPWSSSMRPLLQSEAAECGLACLAMVAAYHGHSVNVGGLRRRFRSSIKGATFTDLVKIASELHLGPRPLRLDLDEIDKLQTPAILHWDLNHFVVLESYISGKATILDPAVGRRVVGNKALNRHFTGVAMELTPTAEFKPVTAKAQTKLSDLWTRLVNFKSSIIQVLVLSLLLQLTVLLTPFLMQLTVDEAISQGDTNLVLILVIGFGFVYLLSAIIQALRSWVVLTFGQSLSFQMSGNVIRHLLRLPMGFFESRHTGDLMSRIRATSPIRSLLSQGVVNTFIDAVLALCTVTVMALINVKLMLVVAVTTLLYAAFRVIIYPSVRLRTEEEIIARANEEGFLLETLRAMRSIKLHVHEALRESSWRNRYAEVISASYRSEIYRISTRLFENILFSIQLLIVIYIAANAVIANQISVGLLFAFLSYRSSFMSSVSSLVDNVQSWRLLSVYLDRLSDIVAEPSERLLPASPHRELLPSPAIRADKIGFSYSPNDPPVLQDVSFEIPAGSFTAIVGPSGSGKSTLTQIMLGLLSPTTGRLLTDDQPLTTASLTQWRGRVGAVMQDDYLLTGTLADNISFFDGVPDFARIEAAAKYACIHDTITTMPMAYQSLIGDMGTALSAGQRQRVMLARALYRDPDALFLDEGTANLDEENERAIANMLERLPITRVIIAHRPALIERADIVFRLVDGQMTRLR